MPSSTLRGTAARHRSTPRRAPHANTPRPASRSVWDNLPVQIVPTENLPGFKDLGLTRGLITALSRAGIDTPFPIQAATIPDILAGRDLLGRAATGSGKTLAFGLPMIARLADAANARPRRPHALVLVPTRELAMQVTDAISPLAASNGLSVRLVAGGLPIQKQIQSLTKGVDVVVATPGRLEDLIARRACVLDEVEVTVLDEADHMADLGFLPVVRRLLDQTPSGQRLLFSATLDGDVALLVEKYLTNPAVHAVSAVSASVDTMTHHLFRVPFDAKSDLVASIAAREGRTLCFVRTKHGADRLARNLGRAGIPAGALHGGRSQSQRTRALDAFKDGSVSVLVATDVAARGIHVDGVTLVLHVDPPADPKDYLHRSGRTARAGEDGVVVVLTTSADERAVRKMLDQAGVRPAQHDAVAGDPTVASVTGARRPSGVAVAEPRRPQQQRPTRLNAPHNRYSSGRRGPSSAGNRNPRRARGA